MLKKYIPILSVLLFMPFSVSFHETNQLVYAESKNELKLVGEAYRNGTLIREYRNAENEETVKLFDVPIDLREKVEASDNPTLEAKKQLMLRYTIIEDQTALKELKNATISTIKASFGVSESYQNVYLSDLKEAESFAKTESKKMSALDKQLIKNNVKGESEKEPTPSSDQTEKNDVTKEKNNHSNASLYVSSGIFILILFGLVFFIFKRR